MQDSETHKHTGIHTQPSPNHTNEERNPFTKSKTQKNALNYIIYFFKLSVQILKWAVYVHKKKSGQVLY